MLIPLLLELRNRKIPVGLQELSALAQALRSGLHQNSGEQFYYLARALLIHDEAHLDDFDQVFLYLYKNIPFASKRMIRDLEDWLSNPKERPKLTEEEVALLKELNVEELKKLFEDRLAEQTERHEGGSRWIGTGGTSPFGTQGVHPSGLSLRSQVGSSAGGRSLLRTADARHYRGYRTDLTLDVRQLEVALRKLRSFDRTGREDELDLERSISETARNFGELEIVLRRPRRPNTRVILMMDVGGSMDPFATLASQLFTAAKRATHWKELRTYYFHNCIYGSVFKTEGLREPVLLHDLFRECDSRYRLILIGDASMAPYELLGWNDPRDPDAARSGLEWLASLRQHYPACAWFNPGISSRREHWNAGSESTVTAISRVIPMYPLSVSGLEEGLRDLSKNQRII
jgi:uncharacterized protein with von Willebrand factor type A (vWA) domain